jgi:hypothetical protein
VPLHVLRDGRCATAFEIERLVDERGRRLFAKSPNDPRVWMRASAALEYEDAGVGTVTVGGVGEEKHARQGRGQGSVEAGEKAHA